MNKAPAFQFYASDFLVDTAEMTNQEVGVYIRLLSHQWVNGNLNSDPNRLANMVGMDLLEVWQELRHKFDLGEDGKLRNPKLEKVRQIQINYRNTQAEAGKKGAAKRWGKEKKKKPTNNNPNNNPNGKSMALQSSSSSSLKDLVEKKILDVLILKSGKKFKHVESHLKFIRARLKQGHSEKDLTGVIERKCLEWKLDPTMRQYLRPETLFNDTKFNSYVAELGQPLPENKKTKQPWEIIPRMDEKLVEWAKVNGYSKPGSIASYDQYRSKLNIEIEIRQNQERNKVAV